jgi:hypothetical protein
MESMRRKSGRPRNELINDAQLMKMLGERKTHKQCADEFGVTIWAVQMAVRRIKKSIAAPVVKTESEENSIDAIKQLSDINKTIVDQLQRCNKMIVREESVTAKLDKLYDDMLDDKKDVSPEMQDVQAAIERRWGNNIKSVLAIQSNLITSSGEIRKQIELQLKIAEAVYNVQMMQEFQGEIIGLLREVDPMIAQRFINKLKERRSIRGLVKM